jgi:plastocyanin
MKKLLLPFTCLLALAGAAPASPQGTATKTVKITRTAFSPTKVTINAGDLITWVNSDTLKHQVVANNGAFVSPVLGAGKSYTFTFRAAGTYNYHDSLYPSIKGTVVVNGPPPAVTLGASQPIIVYGGSIALQGQVTTGQVNQQVSIWAQPLGQASYAQVATVLTTTNGVWQYVGVKPQLLTSYQARWGSRASQAVTVAVQPQIGIGYSHGYLYTRVKAATSFARKTVALQRLSRFGQWVTIRLLKLGKRSGRIVRIGPSLPRGKSRLRVTMSVNQAGPGYLAGFSPTITVRRR